MPNKLRHVMRREVVTVKEGRRLGRPVDVLLDADAHRVGLIVLAAGEVPDSSLVVPAAAVRSFATDALTIESLDSLIVAARDEEALRLLRTGQDMRQHPVLTRPGTDLGRIVSVVIEEDGRVSQYRVRKGILGWILPRRKVTPSELGTLGGEVAVMADEELPEDGSPEPESGAAEDDGVEGEERPAPPWGRGPER